VPATDKKWGKPSKAWCLGSLVPVQIQTTYHSNKKANGRVASSMKSIEAIKRLVLFGLSLAWNQLSPQSITFINQGFVSAFTHPQASFRSNSISKQRSVFNCPSLVSAQYTSRRRKDLSYLMGMTSSDDKSEANDISSSSVFEKALFAIGASTSSLVSLTFFAILAYRRDAFMISFFIGAISNGVMSKVLKRVLNQDRPEELQLADEIKLKPSDKGMPSSHAMSLGFIGTVTALGLPDLSFILSLYVIISLYFRVKTNLHTTEQVLVGLGLGVANAFCWQNLMMGSFPLVPSVNVINMVETYILPQNGVLPLPYLIVPAAIGVAVVGSFERRISRWLKRRENNHEKEH